ncbi:MAG: efflux RND transporter periplasmic adaptor subunit [bacterium]
MSKLMKQAVAVIVPVLLACVGACGDAKSSHQGGGSEASGSGGHGHGSGGDTIRKLKFGKHTELFVEYAPLIAGKHARFTAHFTRLGKRFVPVRKGTLVVTFRGTSGEVRRFTSNGLSRTGIFEPSGEAPAAGVYRVAFELDAAGTRDQHGWMVQVYDSAQAAARRRRDHHDTGGISFPKEQQWVIPFATSAADHRAIRKGFEVDATIEAEPGAHARLSAPIAGVVSSLSENLRMGARVQPNQVLVSVEPVLLQGTDLPQLQLAAVHARQALKLAELRRDQLRDMLRSRAVARLEVDRAEYEVQRHKAALQSAGARLWLYQRSRKRQSGSGHGLKIRAPFAGTVVQRKVARGAAVTAGQLLVELADLSRLRVVAHVASVDLAKATQAKGASLRLPEGRWVDLPHPPLVGGRVEPHSRTVPLAFAWSATEILPLGTWVRVRLLGPERTVVAVPKEAVLDNDGLSVVLVQTGGETFVMRKVGLGAEDRGWVEVTHGVGAGERVVTTGGYQIMLATKLRGGAKLGHGHAH